MSRRTPTIVIVEDDPTDVEMLRMTLKEAGLMPRLEVLSDGERASAFFAACTAENRAPDLVVLDLNLPRKNGAELLREIRTNPATAAVPVIVLTTAAGPDEMAALCAWPNTRCLIKPYVLKEYAPILTTIRATLAAA